MIIISIAHPTGRSSNQLHDYNYNNKAVIEGGRSERTSLYSSSSIANKQFTRQEY
jgi:hypothetical protein